MSENSLILSRSNLSTVSFALGFRFGAVDEPISGISEVLTSHMFRNTANRDENSLALHLDKYGLVTFSNVTKTGLWLGMNCPPQNLDVALSTFDEILFHPEFKEETTNKIVQQQKGGLAQLDQMPQIRLFQRTRWEAAFGDSKISRNTSGTAEGLDLVTPEELNKVYDELKKYSHEFVAVGINIDDTDFEQSISKFDELGRRRSNVELLNNDVKDLNKQVDKMSATTKNAYLGINLRSQGYGASKYEDTVYQNVLSGGFSARFFTQIRDDRNLSYSVFALNSKFHDFGLITSGMDVLPERAAEGRDLVLQIMKEVLTEEIPQEEMSRALKAAQRTALFVSDSSQSYVQWLVGRRLNEQETDLDTVNKEIQAASELDWQEKMLSYWKPENFSLGIAGEPGEAAENWEEAVEKVL